MRKRAKEYLENLKDAVLHTTLDPKGPGVIRIHLKTSKEPWKNPSIVILNGMDIIPINPSWTIMLSLLINHINKFIGKEIGIKETDKIVKDTLRDMKNIYPFTPRFWLKRDLRILFQSLINIACGKEPYAEVKQMSIGSYASYMKAPNRMDLLISAMTRGKEWHCNQKCVHCYAANQEGGCVDELSTDEWKEVLKKLREIGVPQVTFTGGEPTLRADLVELVEAAEWFVTRLNTNGRKLTKELCNQLWNASLDSVQITFYSSEEHIHNELVGVNGFSDTVAGIENALEAGLSVSINTPLCSLNKDYISTLEFLHEKGVRYVTCSGMIETGNARKERSRTTQLKGAELYDIIRDAVEYCNAHEMEIAFTSPGVINPDMIKSLGITVPTCGACLSNMAISPNGEVIPCQSWLSGKGLGNFLNKEWNEIWDGPECSERRKWSAKMLGTCPLRYM